MPDDATVMYLRLLVVGPHCHSLGGAAPLIQLRAGSAVMADVPAAPGQVDIPGENADGKPAGAASYTRGKTDDVFTVKIDVLDEGVPLWQVRITNTESQELGFVWTTAEDPGDAAQPRMSMPHDLEMSVAHKVPANIIQTVANIGPGPLVFTDPAGTELGGGFTLEKVPERVEPNQCGTIEISVDSTISDLTFDSTESTTCVLGCNDRDRRNTTLNLSCKVFVPSGKGFEKPETDGDIHKNGPQSPAEYLRPGDTLRADTLSGVGERAFIDELTALGDSVSRRVHFIRPELRPDMYGGALVHEDPDGAAESGDDET
ncbi:hypothetical protein [Streptomyces sp. NPDC058954]|uniref:hypothetical protein n=1 Tax=Streptomyces sp. NPDC058954 TaxID=3346677 RepID=UPI003682A70D